MYCKVCGNELPAGQKFCGGCGTMVSSPSAQDTTTQKTELLGKLVAVDKVCKTCGNKLDHIQKLNEELENLKKGISSRQFKDGFRRGLNFQLTKKELILLPVALIALLVLEGLLSELGNAGAFVFVPVAIVFAIIAGKFRKKQQEQLKVQIASVEKSIEEENTALSHYVDANKDILSVIPDDYWYPMCTDYLVKMVRTDRASSIPEALNMFDLQLHRWKVEESNAQMLAMQQEQSSKLDSLRTLSAITAAATTYTAFTSGDRRR